MCKQKTKATNFEKRRMQQISILQSSILFFLLSLKLWKGELVEVKGWAADREWVSISFVLTHKRKTKSNHAANYYVNVRKMLLDKKKKQSTQRMRTLNFEQPPLSSSLEF